LSHPSLRATVSPTPTDPPALLQACNPALLQLRL